MRQKSSVGVAVALAFAGAIAASAAARADGVKMGSGWEPAPEGRSANGSRA